MTLRWLSFSRSLLCAMVFCLVFAGSFLAVEPDRALVSYTLREDFQGDGLGQFASYPPAQDIGYEPSITPTTEFSQTGGRALMRVWQPTENGPLRFGFIRQTAMFVTANSSLSVSYRLNVPSGAARIELGIAGSDGCRYTTTIDATVNSWTKLSIPLDKFVCEGKTPASGVGIEAFYLVANIDNANPDFIYRFVIDDVVFSGAHTAGFEFITPAAEHFEPWASYLSPKSYRTGETFSIEVRAGNHLSQANIALKDVDGNVAESVPIYDDGTHGDKRANDSVWTNSAVRRFAGVDVRGVWNAELTGKRQDGKVVRSDLRFVVLPDRSSAHPRLYFDPSQRAVLAARTKDPRLAKVWEYVITTANTSRSSGVLKNGSDVFEQLDTAYLLPSLLGYFDVLNRARFRISYNAFVAYTTGDTEARASAKEALLYASRWSRWEPPWFTAHGQHTYYPAGQLAADVALGYDLLYDDLTDSERSLVRKALINNSIIPTWKEYFVDDRAMANTSNWIAHTVGGALIAASAIAGDVTPEESGGKFDLYVNGLLLKFEAHIKASYLPDGSYGEGISYQEFDSETLTAAIPALERAFGVNYWDTTHVLESTAYPLYTMTDPVAASLDMGDTHPPAGHGIAPLVFRSRDPIVRWYYSRFDRPSLQQFIFYNNSVVPKSPMEAGLPTSRIFEAKGNAVFRTGWGENEIVMLFRAGPTFNHHHADQGAFLLTAFGEPLITEAGWSDYYKDPYYATYFTQAIGHNTMLVDGDPESQSIPDTRQFSALDSYPTITDSVTSDLYDAVSGDLASVYKGRLSKYSRRIVFVKPYYFVVLDDIKTNGGPARFDFLLHTPDRQRIKTQGLSATYKGDNASLAVRSFSGDEVSLTVKNGRIPYHIFSTKTPADTPARPAYLDFRTTNPQREIQFLTALVPAKNENAAQDLAEEMTQFSSANLRGLRVERGNETDLLMFRLGDTGAAISHNGFTTDALVLTVTETAAGLQMLGAQSVRSVRSVNRNIFASNVLANVAVRFRADQIDFSCQVNADAKITLFTGKAPDRVLVDELQLKQNAFSFDERTKLLSLRIPAGRHEVKILF